MDTVMDKVVHQIIDLSLDKKESKYLPQ